MTKPQNCLRIHKYIHTNKLQIQRSTTPDFLTRPSNLRTMQTSAPSVTPFASCSSCTHLQDESTNGQNVIIQFQKFQNQAFTCSAYSAYSAIHSSYADILRGSDNLSAILKTPPGRLSSYVYALFTHRDFILHCKITPFQEGDTYQEHMYALVPQVKIGLFMNDKNSNSNHCN